MKILIVDDEPINRIMLLSMLNDAGYTDCIEAQNGADALEIAHREQPDLVLLDVMMPGMSGFEVAPAIKEMAKGSYLPILFITALDDNDSLVKCLEVGGNDFATKPFDKHILTAKIRAHEKIRALSKHIEEQNTALRFYKQQVAREHAIVEHIFSHAIVNQPEIKAFFDCVLAPAETFNGDLFLCQPSPSGGLYFIVGDFTGHGLASAIGALPVTRAFQEMSLKGLAVSEIATEINDILLTFLPGDMFMAGIVGEIGSDGKRVTLWQGGIPQSLVVHSETRQINRYPAKHMALGILERDEFDCLVDNFELAYGDRLVMYTDGLVEVNDESGNMLGESGIEQWFELDNSLSLEGVYNQALNYSSTQTFDDDVTIVAYTAQSLETLNPTSESDDIPSDIVITLSASHIKKDDVLERILSVAGQCSGITHVRSTLFTLLSEMFSNALEHGILGMDSQMKHSPDGFVEYYTEREKRISNLEDATLVVKLQSRPDKKEVQLSVTDSGDGFDHSTIDFESAEASFGRGLSLIQALSAKVWFEDSGRKISCILSTDVSNSVEG